MDTIFNMPMDEAERRYLQQRPVQPIQQVQQRGIADYLPNIFGGNPAQIAGLLGEEQAGAISRQANVSGLLGAAIAIANGMSSQGPRRSAAQNILNALGTGLQTSQGVYQNALQQGLVSQRMAKDAQEAQLAQMRSMTEFQKQQQELFKQQRLQVIRQKMANGEPLTDADLMELDGSKFVDAKLRDPKAPSTQQFPDGTLRQWNPQAQAWQVVGEAQPKAQFSGEYENLSLSMFGTGDVSKLTPEQRTAVAKEAERLGISKANATAPKVSVNTGDPTAVAGKAMEVNEKFTVLTKQDREIASRYNQLLSAYSNPAMGGTGDAAMIYSVAKILDPDGAVREGDVAMIAGNRTYPDSLRAIATKFVSNQRLNQQERDQIMSLGYEIMAKKAKAADRTAAQYRGFAKTFGVTDPDALIRSPYADLAKPEYRVVKFNGKDVRARYSPTEGKYFVQSGSKFIPIED